MPLNANFSEITIKSIACHCYVKKETGQDNERIGSRGKETPCKVDVGERRNRNRIRLCEKMLLPVFSILQIRRKWWKLIWVWYHITFTWG
jgi:hypothetical protein